MIMYEGRRGPDDVCKVFVVRDGVSTPLPPRLDLANKSPGGYEWGYAGSGPAQLALAICADALGDDAKALRLYQGFKGRIVQSLARNGWSVSRDTVLLVLAAIERDGSRRRLQPTFGRHTESGHRSPTR